MNSTKRTLVVGLGGFALAASLVQSADLVPMVVSNLTGQLRIQQGVPCDDIDQTTPVSGGRIEISPAEGLDVSGGKRFVLTRAVVTFVPFTISHSCLGFGETRNYTAVGAQLDRAVSFVASPGAGGVYDVVIPKGDVLFREASTVNGDPETGYKQPVEDVTGSINLTTGEVRMHVVLATSIHFSAGCVDGHCIIDETDNGTLTTDLAGTAVFPDSDGDGVPDRSDNCRFTANADQTPVPTPVVTAPAAITINSCADHHIGTAVAVDVCDASAVTITSNAPATFAIGPNVVTWTGVDGKSRSGTATQDVTVVDTTAPTFTFVPPPIALNDCKATDLGTPTATDDCAGTVTFSNNAPAIFPVGATPVTWTATDVSGNHTSAIQLVTVTDTVAPTVSCVATQPPGNSFKVSSFDACGAPVLRLGSYVLAEGEVIKINGTGQPGVQLINVVNGIRHFHVGKGQSIITATDGSGNVTTAICR